MAFRISRNTTITEPATHEFTINIVTSMSSGVGPLGVHFDAITSSTFGAISDPMKHLSFWWDFGDTGAVFENAGRAGEVFGTDANIAQGAFVGHIYPENVSGGDVIYTVTCYVYDHLTGNSGKGTTTITVVDTNSFFSPSETIIVSVSGDFTGAPAGAAQTTNIRDALNGQQFINKKRILLRSGEEFILDGNEDYSTNLQVPRESTATLFFGVFGGNQNATLKTIQTVTSSLTNFLFWARNGARAIFSKIDFAGNYDSSTGTGYDARITVVRNDKAHVDIVDCKVSGYNRLVDDITPSTEQGFVFIQNCDITNWSDFGFWITSAKFSARGCSIKQAINAVSGDDAKQFNVEPIWADHGPIRFDYSRDSHISQCDMFSNNGWSSNGLAHQPCIRYSSGGAINHRGVINQNVLEGGFEVVAIGTQNGSTTANLGACVFESNLLIATPNTNAFVSLDYGNTLIRNNVAIRQDFPTSNGGLAPFDSFIYNNSGKASSAANLSTETIVANNTIVTLQSDAGAVDFSLLENPLSLNITESNNIIYAPSVPNAASFTDYSPLIAADYYSPAGTSPAVNAMSIGQVIYDTFDGDARGALTNIGALSTTQIVGPTANAGPDRNIDAGQKTTLIGINSEGIIVSFKWAQTGGDAGAVIQGGNQPNPTIITPYSLTPQSYTFTLTVADNLGLTDTDTVTVNTVPGNDFRSNVTRGFTKG